jgi:hypothetical protein
MPYKHSAFYIVCTFYHNHLILILEKYNRNKLKHLIDILIQNNPIKLDYVFILSIIINSIEFNINP